MHRRHLLLLAGLALVGSLFAATPVPVAAVAPAGSRAEELRAVLYDARSPRVLVVSHRGDWRGFPENSVPAIRSAIKLGVDIIEIDIARTKDGEFVLMHDRTLDRTTTGKGKVADYTLAEIRALKLRNGCGIETPYGVPTLEEALLAVKDRVLLNIDKGFEWGNEILPLLEKTGTARQVVIKAYGTPAEKVLAAHPAVLDQAVFMPIITFGKKLDAAAVVAIAEGHLRLIKAPAMEIVFPEWNPAVAGLYAACKTNGVRIWANVLWSGMSGPRSDDQALDDPEANYGWLLKQGATIIQSDRPAYLIDYLRQKGLHP
ncbi:glycerophosphodiester phosphodiesterase family protein [Opitutus sp. ER46]|uniref:glycerophosphodiester phosphodiesterase family protein n=1 Tax=Opitutus sp. ER46 TaxID=2161864 RepID=UPI000D324588|nr:glycerophosphodiester phosphodiesterase family protein [Opitutus sp. ER46]PTX92274.1 glycerophosphodiester phosphodiesterase [Opitutus sp. ER46]